MAGERSRSREQDYTNRRATARGLMGCSVFLLAVSILISTSAFGDSRAGLPSTMTFVATAYSLKGRTASGTTGHAGTVAADPAVLPLGSRIQIKGAGKYSGDYTVTDTGASVKARRIDIHMATEAEAKKFGKQRVRVQILERGDPSSLKP